MSDEEAPKILSIDVGSYETKSGFSGDDAPRSVISTISGHSNHKTMLNGDIQLNHQQYIGDIKERGYLEITNIISNGEIQNWESFEKLLHQIFYTELRVAPDEYMCYMTDPAFGSRKQKEQKTQILFETFSLHGLSFANPAPLSVVASGRNTALAVDVGETTIELCAIKDGFDIKPAQQRFNFGGKDLTQTLIKLMTQRDYRFETSQDFFRADEIKRNISFVSEDFKGDMQTSKESNKLEKKHQLPDGTEITLGSERFLCQEVLFNPKLINKDLKGIHEIVNESLNLIDREMRRDFHANILLSGGSTMAPGFSDRMHVEVASLVPKASKIKIVAPPERKYSAWIGASIVSSLSYFTEKCVSMDDYNEYGPAIMHKDLF